MNSKTRRFLFFAMCSALLPAITAEAVPVLQVGAPAGVSDSGIYADYQGSLSNPTEADTAVTSGGVLLVAGAYKANNPELLLGGQFIGVQGTGRNWSDFGYNATFNTRRAVLMATVPDGTLGGVGNSILVGGNGAFYSTGTFEDGFVVPNPPSNHDPIKNQDYLFFDIGDFSKSTSGMPNFVDETVNANQVGEIKSLALAITGFQWVHFDVFALLTDVQGGGPNTRLVTSMEGNPGSHDVTWKDGGNGGGGGGGGNPIPEPGTVILLGSGLLGLALYGRRRLGR